MKHWFGGHYSDDELRFIVCAYCETRYDDDDCTVEEWEQLTNNLQNPMCLECKRATAKATPSQIDYDDDDAYEPGDPKRSSNWPWGKR